MPMSAFGPIADIPMPELNAQKQTLRGGNCGPGLAGLLMPGLRQQSMKQSPQVAEPRGESSETAIVAMCRDRRRPVVYH
jgi:hypothetical protein